MAMRVSRSTGYAVLAACYIAKNQGKGVILSQSVSKAYDIPLEYLLKILQQLVRANVLRSKRGPRGGFCLAKPATKINLLEVIEAIEGPMSGDLNLQEQAKGEKFSKKADEVYEKAVNSSKAIFAKTKISTLIAEGKK
jgi:Rrf2 family protein